MHRFIIDPQAIKNGAVEIVGPELRHLNRVLRLKKGAMVELIDPEGNISAARLITVGKTRALVKIIATRRQKDDCVQTLLAVGILKGPRMDLIVEKAVEFGIGTLVPLLSEHANPGLYAPGRIQRWHRLAIAAGKQCGRAVPLTINEPTGLTDLLASNHDFTVRVLFHERGKTVRAARLIDLPWNKKGKKMAIIGPEGGFSQSEVNLARDMGVSLAGLGPRVLRAETAAMAAMTLMRVFTDQEEE